MRWSRALAAALLLLAAGCRGVRGADAESTLPHALSPSSEDPLAAVLHALLPGMPRGIEPVPVLTREAVGLTFVVRW